MSTVSDFSRNPEKLGFMTKSARELPMALPFTDEFYDTDSLTVSGRIHHGPQRPTSAFSSASQRFAKIKNEVPDAGRYNPLNGRGTKSMVHMSSHGDRMPREKTSNIGPGTYDPRAPKPKQVPAWSKSNAKAIALPFSASYGPDAYDVTSLTVSGNLGRKPRAAPFGSEDRFKAPAPRTPDTFYDAPASTISGRAGKVRRTANGFSAEARFVAGKPAAPGPGTYESQSSLRLSRNRQSNEWGKTKRGLPAAWSADLTHDTSQYDIGGAAARKDARLSSASAFRSATPRFAPVKSETPDPGAYEVSRPILRRSAVRTGTFGSVPRFA